MNKNVLVAIVVLVVLAAAGFAAYAFITAPTKAPTPIERPATSTQPQTTPEAPTMPTVDAPSGTYKIVADSSKASFSIYEKLRGEPKTVIGTTNFISGYFEADPANLGEASISAIRINARTFVTDSTQRDNTTRRMILKTEEDTNEFIVFTPNLIEGLPATAKLDQEFTYRILGDLMISGVTKEATFEGSGKFTSDSEFVGMASTTVMRSDFNLVVPSFPFLADVADNVGLQIEFVAKK